ncbi:hypothetical protein J2S55_003179 [Streptosporangium brasiliense]|uniref:Uncharacterized protein n=1 Tax=Streptosporangium brasiliense TaxID=47480 RepID=A0ABT9R3U0_9ACTN|nr:hypothetical protein [Streptosporangium brasiliense]
MDNSRAVPLAEGTYPQQQYLHLVRLAWDLRWLGVGVRVELAPSQEPCLVVSRAAGPVRVLALLRGGRWVYSWGRGRNQWIAALSEDAAPTIRKVAAE